ncbi:class I SAM-dependent methyltransferase, partial [Candidatus Poribacteria bacterium]|nr:class I SAM-dependent methyltransferase [Candidatus Poribacteria bacterium]
LVQLARHCGHILGVDSSEAMLTVCRNKLRGARIPSEKAEVLFGDITSLKLERTFDLITAPFRVFQNLETDEEIDGFFETVRLSLKETGTCVLNVFDPFLSKEDMATKWLFEGEMLVWRMPIEGGRLDFCERRLRIDRERQIIYPELIFRRYRGEELEDEAVMKILMRYYYAEEFEATVTRHGFRILNRWGGYEGEPYGEGSELVLEFCVE